MRTHLKDDTIKYAIGASLYLQLATGYGYSGSRDLEMERRWKIACLRKLKDTILCTYRMKLMLVAYPGGFNSAPSPHEISGSILISISI